jgi:apolipoprotein N-acyltransferase
VSCLPSGGYGLAFSHPATAFGILIALPAIFFLARLPTPRQAFYGGLLLGMAIYSPHLFFFVHVFGRMASALFLIAGFPIGIFLLLAHFAHKRLRPAMAFWMMPILWTGIEFFRSELYQLRFAWLLPGQAAVFLPGARWLVIGVYGIGFIYALAAAMVVSRRRGVQIAGIVASISIGILMYWPALPAVDQRSSLHVAGIQLESPDVAVVVNALDRLALAHPEAQLLVLSEYTFGGPVPPEVRAVIKKHHRYLIAGGIRFLDDEKFYDTAFVIGPDGKDLFSQAKSVPVQFMQDGLAADHREVWNSPWGKIGIAVCYDLSYARVMDDFVRAGAQGLIVPTMDLTSWGPYERRMLHGRMAPMRSAEYQIPVFGVWSSGVSQLTDRTGRVIATAGYPGQSEMISGPFPLGKPGRVPMDRWFAAACTMGTGVLIGFLMIGRIIFAFESHRHGRK